MWGTFKVENRIKHKHPVSMFVLKLQKYCTSLYNIFTYFEGMYSILDEQLAIIPQNYKHLGRDINVNTEQVVLRTYLTCMRQWKTYTIRYNGVCFNLTNLYWVKLTMFCLYTTPSFSLKLWLFVVMYILFIDLSAK